MHLGIFCANNAITKTTKSPADHFASWCSLNWTGMIRMRAVSMLNRAALFVAIHNDRSVCIVLARGY